MVNVLNVPISTSSTMLLVIQHMLNFDLVLNQQLLLILKIDDAEVSDDYGPDRSRAASVSSKEKMC